MDIIKETKTDFPLINAVVIGGGEEREALALKIKENDLTKNVTLLGIISREQVFEFMKKSRLFLHTSSYEGQSAVMTEAPASGLSVVCFDVGRLHEESKMYICKDKSEMLNKLKKLLHSELIYTPLVLKTMDSSVSEFMKVYEDNFK